MSRRVARRPYKPKPESPGQRITWRPPDEDQAERTGTIWSDGPLPKSVWVLPDDAPGGTVLVSLQHLSEWPGYGPDWQRDTVRRCDHLNHSAGLFAETQTVDARGGLYGPPVQREHLVAYHCDRDCPAIRHDTRECTAYELTSGDVIRMLLSGEGNGRHDLCQSCVYLAGPEDNGTGQTHAPATTPKQGA